MHARTWIVATLVVLTVLAGGGIASGQLPAAQPDPAIQPGPDGTFTLFSGGVYVLQVKIRNECDWEQRVSIIWFGRELEPQKFIVIPPKGSRNDTYVVKGPVPPPARPERVLVLPFHEESRDGNKICVRDAFSGSWTVDWLPPPPDTTPPARGEVRAVEFTLTQRVVTATGGTPDPPRTDPPQTDPPKTDPPKTDPPQTAAGPGPLVDEALSANLAHARAADRCDTAEMERQLRELEQLERQASDDFERARVTAMDFRPPLSAAAWEATLRQIQQILQAARQRQARNCPTPPSIGLRIGVGSVMGGYTSDMSDLTWTVKQELDVLLLNSVPFDEERSSTVDPDFDVDGGIRGAGSSFVVKIPGGRGATARALGLFAAQSPAARGGGSRLVTHHAILSIGRADAELDYHNRQSGRDTHWEGSGVHWGIGYGALIELCGDCHWFLNTSYVYSKLPSTDMSRSPALDFTPFGGRLTRDEGSFEWQAHAFEATVGRATSYIFPYIGLRTAVRSASLDGHVDVDYALPNGQLGQLRNSFTNDFEKTTVQALVGAQVRVPRTNLFVRVEGATDGDNSRVGLNFGYGWYR